MEELAIVNQELKELGKEIISSGRINLFTPSKKVSKNQKARLYNYILEKIIKLDLELVQME